MIGRTGADPSQPGPGRGGCSASLIAEVGTRDERLETRERGSLPAGERVLVVAVLLVVVGYGGRGGSGLGRSVAVCGGMPVLLHLQQHPDLLRGSGAGYQHIPRPAERAGDGQHHRHVSAPSSLHVSSAWSHFSQHFPPIKQCHPLPLSCVSETEPALIFSIFCAEFESHACV